MYTRWSGEALLEKGRKNKRMRRYLQVGEEKERTTSDKLSSNHLQHQYYLSSLSLLLASHRLLFSTLVFTVDTEFCMHLSLAYGSELTPMNGVIVDQGTLHELNFNFFFIRCSIDRCWELYPNTRLG